MHMVPVVWIEYLPIERRSQMAVQKKQSTRLDININSATKQFKDMLNSYSDGGAWLYERGVFAMLTGKPLTAAAVKGMSGCTESLDEAAIANAEADAEDLAFIVSQEAARHDRSNTPDTDADALLTDDSAETKEVEVKEEEIEQSSENEEQN